MMEKIKVQVNNGGNFEVKPFSSFASVICDGDIKTAATCCLVKALAEKILDDFEESEETAFGDIIIVNKTTAEDVKILNTICKMNYNIINAIGNTTHFFISHLGETDDNIAVTFDAYAIVKSHVYEAYLAACSYNNTIFHEGISVLYTNANTVILLPTVSVKLHYGEFEEVYFKDETNEKTIMLSNYNGPAAYTAARFLFKAAYGVVEKINEDIHEDVYVEKGLIKAIAKVMLINAEA